MINELLISSMIVSKLTCENFSFVSAVNFLKKDENENSV